VSGDRLILRQAIVNLFDNAIKSSPAKSRIEVVVGESDGRAILDITDQGPGIPNEHQPYVFDRFYRVDKARSRAWGGAGLGLSIARWAVEAHGGELTLKSKEGEGTTFRISLPLASHIPSGESKGGLVRDTPK
jgi:two-component system, OmpR family, sensor kinase